MPSGAGKERICEDLVRYSFRFVSYRLHMWSSSPLSWCCSGQRLGVENAEELVHRCCGQPLFGVDVGVEVNVVVIVVGADGRRQRLVQMTCEIAGHDACRREMPPRALISLSDYRRQFPLSFCSSCVPPGAGFSNMCESVAFCS